MSDRLPTSLFVEAHLKVLSDKGSYYYFIQKGNASSGLILLKINALNGFVKLIMQERDFMTNEMTWVNALSSNDTEEKVEEKDADAYIQRAMMRDPDLWVLEIEDPDMQNPFEV